MPNFHAKIVNGNTGHSYASQFAYLEITGFGKIPTPVAINPRYPDSYCSRSFANSFRLCELLPQGDAIKDGMLAVAGNTRLKVGFIGKHAGKLNFGKSEKVDFKVTEDSNILSDTPELRSHLLVLGTDFIRAYYRGFWGNVYYSTTLLNGGCV